MSGRQTPDLEIDAMRLSVLPFGTTHLDTLRRCGFAAIVAAAATLAIAAPAAAQPVHHKHHAYHHTAYSHTSYGHHHHGRLTYVPRGTSERGSGYVELVGDPDSGVGFYPLPYHVRVGAWRYAMRHRAPPWIENGVLYAEMADAARYPYAYWTTPANSYRYGVYDPYAGSGTPYFAGYYGPSGDGDEPSFPFGQPYQR
jgi:hypothetical protein